MSPAEAAALTEEPDWAAQFADSGGSAIAFENILTAWRKWHFTPLDDGRKKMASSVDGVIALALLGIMPPRALPPSTIPCYRGGHNCRWPACEPTCDGRPGLFEEQHDNHTWLVTEGRAWRIVGIEDMTLFLDSFGEPRQIDLSRAKWEKYSEAWAAALEAMRK